MCGKFTQMASWREVHAFSQALTDGALSDGAAGDGAVLTATPMRFAHILRLDADGRREVVPMRWGFPDRRASAPGRPKHMHARAETIDERPTFANAFAHARGVLLVRTFNEGEDLPSGKTKQWVFTPRDGRPLAIAVIWEEWRREADGGEETLETFVMATTPPNALIARVTDRMPAFLRLQDVPLWLGETDAPLSEVKAALRTYEDDGNWEMTEQATGRPWSPGESQGDLF